MRKGNRGVKTKGIFAQARDLFASMEEKKREISEHLFGAVREDGAISVSVRGDRQIFNIHVDDEAWEKLGRDRVVELIKESVNEGLIRANIAWAQGLNAAAAPVMEDAEKSSLVMDGPDSSPSVEKASKETEGA